jgi:hypothetical protein
VEFEILSLLQQNKEISVRLKSSDKSLMLDLKERFRNEKNIFNGFGFG